MNVSKSLCDGERKHFFELKEECEVSCVKIIARSIVAQEGTNTLVFYIFEYVAKYGAKSGVK